MQQRKQIIGHTYCLIFLKFEVLRRNGIGQLFKKIKQLIIHLPCPIIVVSIIEQLYAALILHQILQI